MNIDAVHIKDEYGKWRPLGFANLESPPFFSNDVTGWLEPQPLPGWPKDEHPAPQAAETFMFTYWMTLMSDVELALGYGPESSESTRYTLSMVVEATDRVLSDLRAQARQRKLHIAYRRRQLARRKRGRR